MSAKGLKGSFLPTTLVKPGLRDAVEHREVVDEVVAALDVAEVGEEGAMQVELAVDVLADGEVLVDDGVRHVVPEVVGEPAQQAKSDHHVHVTTKDSFLLLFALLVPPLSRAT